MGKYFQGKYRNTLDSKGRVIVPSKFRDKLDGRFMLGKGLDQCYVIYTMEDWDQYAERLAALPSKANELKRQIFSSTLEQEVDKTGRTQLTKEQRDDLHLDIGDEVVFVGNGPRAELWPASVYDARYNVSAEEEEARRERLNAIAQEFDM